MKHVGLGTAARLFVTFSWQGMSFPLGCVVQRLWSYFRIAHHIAQGFVLHEARDFMEEGWVQSKGKQEPDSEANPPKGLSDTI